VTARRATLARKAAERAAGDAPVAAAGEPELGPSDDEALEVELRHERALAAASSVPVRTPKASDAKRTRAGRPGRPTGKKRR
jgi:preprotein translocase subunit SecF